MEGQFVADNTNWVVEVKGPKGVKQVELTDGLVQAYRAGTKGYRSKDYAVAAWLAFLEIESGNV